ncbi:hypothetical protein Tco_1375950 [Tanacetum coccineum]
MTTTITQQVALDNALICPRLSNQDFDELPSDEEIVSFIKELGHKGNIKSITDVVVDQMHQPWRTFASIINKCLFGKIIGLDKMRLSRAQILWGMYYKKNIDFVELLWEDFVFQIDNRDTKKQEKMYYPRFTKVVIHHFITKDKTISMRNRLFMHTSQDDCVLSTMRFVSKSEDFQVYGALIPEVMTNPKMRNSRAYKTYLAYATGAATPKKARKFKKPASPSKKRTLVTVEKEEPEPAKKVVPSKNPLRKQTTGVRIRDTPGVFVSKKKAPATTGKSKGIDLLSEAALLEEAQVKKVLKKSKRETTIHQAGDSGDGASFQPEVPDEPKGKSVDTHEGTGLNPGVPDVSKTDSSESEYESWGDSSDEANLQGDDEDVQDIPTDDETNDESNDVDKEEYDRIDKELYGDINVRLTDAKQDDEGEEDADNTVLQYPNAVKEYLGTSLFDALYKVLKKHDADIIKEFSVPAEIIEHASKQQVPKFTITSSDTVALEEFDQKTTLFNTMTNSKSFNKSLKHRSLYHALVESILEDEDVMDEGVADKLKKRKPYDTDQDEGPSARLDRGLKRQRTSKGIETSKKMSTSNDSSKRKSPSTSSKSSKSGKFTKDQVEEPIFVQDSDYAKHDDVEFNNTDMPLDQGENLDKTDEQPNNEAFPKNDWYKKSSSDTSPDPE